MIKKDLISSGFIKILTKFSKKEVRSFRKWLNSPWCNSNKNLVALFEAIVPFHGSFKSNKFTKEYLLKEIKPDAVITETLLHNLMSAGTKQAEKFMIHYALEQDENNQENFLCQEFQKRGLRQLFFKKSDRAIKRLEGKKVKSWEDHADLVKHYRRQYHAPSENPFHEDNHSRVVEGIDKNLDSMFLPEKGILLNEKYNLKRIIKAKEIDSEKLNQDVEKWLKDTKEEKGTSITLSRTRIEFLKNADSDSSEYENLKNYFLNNYKSLDFIEQKIHLIFLLNDSKELRRKGELKIGDYFPLFDLGINEKILSPSGQLSYKTFASIVTASNWGSEFDFSENFIKKYIPTLPKNVQKDCKNWAYAHLFYSKKNRDESIQILNKNNFEHPYFRIITGGLAIQNYFDDFLEPPSENKKFVTDLCDNYTKRLRYEKTQSPRTRKGFINFAQAVRKMVNEFSKPDFDKERFLKILKDKENIQGIDWLKAKEAEILEKKWC